MGAVCGLGLTPEQKEEKKRNKQLGKQLKRDRADDDETIKLLLLGAGESGKSTLFKQMKLLYTAQKDFPMGDREDARAPIHQNIVSDLRHLVIAASVEKMKSTAAGQEIASWVGKEERVDVHRARLLKEAWEDPTVQQMWHNRANLQIQDSLAYFMDNLERIAKPGYLPDNRDIILTRIRTSGVVQNHFTIDGANLLMVDVGGQRTERKKWINCFDGVTCVMFVVAISEYNQSLFEDPTANRQDEAVQLFKTQLQLATFRDKPFILFLNKTDLFRKKLPKHPFRVASGQSARNVDFEGPHCDMNKHYETDETDQEYETCYSAACNYLQQLYEGQQGETRTSTIYTKFTNSTDTKQVGHIMEACKDIIMRKNMNNAGWLPEV